MSSRHLRTLIQHLRRSVCPHGDETLSVAQLLERWVRQRDEAAFEVLLCRHGPMVLSVCRRLLRDSHDVEDAFQAAFLTLVRKGASIRRPQALAAWLYRVAYRIALRLRVEAAERVRREQPGAEKLTSAEGEEPASRDLRMVLDEEIDALPERYRQVFVLCHLEGKTHAEAARLLGRPTGTVSCWLKRGRERLRERLTRRGFASAAIVALGESEAQAALHTALVQSTCRAATVFTAGGDGVAAVISVRVAALVDAAGREMAAAKLQWTLVIGLTLSMAAAGASMWAYQPPAKPQAKAQAPEPPRKQQEQSARTDRYSDPLPVGARVRLGTMRLRHRQPITAVAYSPDGSLLASSGWDEVIHLWDANTGQSIRELTEPRRTINLAIAFSPDGTKLASTGETGNVRLWDVKSGRKLMDAKGHKDRAFGLAFAPDGQLFASAGQDGKVRLWDAKTGAQLRTFSPGVVSQENSHPLTFSPDSRTLAAGLGGTIWLWDIKTGEQCLAIPKAHGRAVISLAFLDKDTLVSGGFRYVAAGTVDGQASLRGVGELRFWDAATGKKLRDLTEDGSDQDGCGLAVSRKGEFLAISFRDEIWLWDLRAQKLLRRLTDYHHPFSQGAHDLMFSPDGKRLAAVMGDNVIHIWDTASGHRVLDYPQAHRTALRSVAYSPDGRQAATAGQDGVGRLWDVATAKQIGRLRFSERPVSGIEVVAFSSDGRTLAAGGYEFTPQSSIGWLKLWDRKSGVELWTKRSESRVSALTFSLDGQSVAVATGAVAGEGARENAIRIYERDAGKERGQRTDLTRRVRALVFSPDGKLLHSYGDDRILRVWEWSSKKPPTEHSLNKERSPHRSVTFSPDGKLLATSVGFTDTIVLWDANTGTELSKIRVEKSMGSVLAFSPDGRVLATSSTGGVNSEKPFDSDLHLWDLMTEREIRRLRPGRATVSALAFSPDGREILAGMDNGTGLIWSVTSSTQNGRQPKEQMEEKALKGLWADLGGEDTARAYEAIGSLASAPKVALPFLRGHLQPAKPADSQSIRQLIADLDSGEFARREAAYHALEALGGEVRPALRKALEGKPTLEQRKRLEALLAAPHTIRQPELLRQVRGVQVLEMIGSEEARLVLRSVADGAAQARLTGEAKASLERLTARRPAEKR